MSESEELAEERSAGSCGWKDVAAQLTEASESEHEALIHWVVTKIPEDFQEVPDFRLPPSLRREWRFNKRFRAALHAWRMEFDADYRAWRLHKQMRRGTKKRGWEYAVDMANQFMEQLEEAGEPASILVQVQGLKAMLETTSLAADKKQKAVHELTSLMQDWEERRKAQENAGEIAKQEEYDKARKMRTLDLVRAIRNAES